MHDGFLGASVVIIAENDCRDRWPQVALQHKLSHFTLYMFSASVKSKFLFVPIFFGCHIIKRQMTDLCNLVTAKVTQ